MPSTLPSRTLRQGRKGRVHHHGSSKNRLPQILLVGALCLALVGVYLMQSLAVENMNSTATTPLNSLQKQAQRKPSNQESLKPESKKKEKSKPKPPPKAQDMDEKAKPKPVQAVQKEQEPKQVAQKQEVAALVPPQQQQEERKDEAAVKKQADVAAAPPKAHHVVKPRHVDAHAAHHGKDAVNLHANDSHNQQHHPPPLVQPNKQGPPAVQKEPNKDEPKVGDNKKDQHGQNEVEKNRQAEKEKARHAHPKPVRKKVTVNKQKTEGDPRQDPLRNPDYNRTGTPLTFKPAVEWLGVLVDGGRHFFPIPWLKRMLDRLADMHYNLIQLRLTDDQAFNVLLDSHPELAYPSAVDNPLKQVYTANELRELTKYAKERGIRIMPEINVPGHAGAWAGIPHLVAHCPKFICDKGYGLPLNVTHPDVRTILTDIIREVIDIFDNPPFLHLGGDEVNMAGACFDEMDSEVFDYPAFEVLLKEIVKDVGYNETQIVRWEMTGQKELKRAGDIEQFWESYPGERHDAKGRFFLSNQLYFDTNGDQNAYEVYIRANKSFHLKKGVIPTALIAGCFELSTEFWYDRNILGRLLAVAMGAANMTIPGNNQNELEHAVVEKWITYCEHLGYSDEICSTQGSGVIPHRTYHAKWREKWVVWKAAICERMTESVPVRNFKSPSASIQRTVVNKANVYFWDHFAESLNQVASLGKSHLKPLEGDLSGLGRRAVPHTGLILDTTGSLVKVDRLHGIIKDFAAKLNFNMVQLRLVNNNGFAFEMDYHQKLGHSLLAGKDNHLYHLESELKDIVKIANQHGIEVVPEISVSTDAAGWYNAGGLVQCPIHLCDGRGVPNNIEDTMTISILFSVIAELRKVFASKFLHLGSDERKENMPCFQEVGLRPHFDVFEHKLKALLNLNDISADNIIRWENAEHEHYESRTGAITQYRAGTAVADMRTDKPFFATVDLFEGGAWGIYQRTRELVALKPLGVLLQARSLTRDRWAKTNAAGRLLAFAMGVSELPTVSDPAVFAKTWTKACRFVRLNDNANCTMPEPMNETIVYITETDEFREMHCDLRTVETKKNIAKFVEPFYNSTAVEAMKAATAPKVSSWWRL